MRTIGIDISREMIREHDSETGDFVQATASALPFSAGSIDAVHMDTVLHHIVGRTVSTSKEKAIAVLSAIFEALTDGGTLVFTELCVRGAVLSGRTISSAIFYGLKASPVVMSFFDSNAQGDLLVSFYTESELIEMVEKAGGIVVEKSVGKRFDVGLKKRPFTREWGHVHFICEKI